uniref:Inter-alpha-trypsin inhibitor heavy chain H3-like n=1 Tax=Romanomermis culicivorax TaxID=13658 RepID=A0A915J7Q7_ROMCU
MFSLLFSLILFSISYVMSDQIIGQQVEYLKIRSTIQSRFAVTTFSSKIRNLENKAREIFFHTVIPEEAFITNFSMLIKDDIIYGNVQEKEKAKETYSKAVERGQSAGLVAEKPRETNSFQISVNVGANESVIFDLTYQEVLKRVHGFYKHVINVETEEQVQDMNIEVKISEMGKIKSVKVPKFEPKIGEKTNLELLSSPGEPNANIDIIDLGGISEATVKFSGDETLSNKTVGQLAVLYDVQRDETAGSVQVLDGHFVHFFAPSGLTKGKKHIFFVLDRSGSMSGKKFAQLKDAMKRIIGELDEQDKFNILFFDHKLYPWKLESVMATKERKQEAIQHVINTETAGATDIFLALKTAIERIQIEYTDNFSPMILFLTDGEATSGIQDNNLIVQKVTELNKNSTVSGATCSIHGLAFGRGADYKLVQRLSANNRGLAKKIFEDADADLQLTGFYAEIASPLLSDVKFHYLNGTVDVNSLAMVPVSQTAQAAGPRTGARKIGTVDQFARPRETNSFQISVNVGANESVTFNLTYQEVLKRVHGVYKHVINVETEKDAMKRIIGELDEQDKFNILFFDHKLYPWKLESVMATKERKQEAVEHVMNAEIAGATDIFLALKTALERIQIEYTENFSPMILFLTDGEATSGIQDNDLIVQKVTELNKNSTVSGATCSIHCLAFGRGADYKLAQRLSTNNRGLAKKIFEDADADLQLT